MSVWLQVDSKVKGGRRSKKLEGRAPHQVLQANSSVTTSGASVQPSRECHSAGLVKILIGLWGQHCIRRQQHVQNISIVTVQLGYLSSPHHFYFDKRAQEQPNNVSTSQGPIDWVVGVAILAFREEHVRSWSTTLTGSPVKVSQSGLHPQQFSASICQLLGRASAWWHYQ